MKHRSAALFSLVVLITSSCSTTDQPRAAGRSSTARVATDSQRAEQVASSQPALKIDYGREDHRVVAERDQICTVLRNGLTIIAKRIPSPVVSVQGLCHTGSVYEGRWLGGGLSHLLEHLLAGGSNDRRTEQQDRDLLQNIGDNSNAFTEYDKTVFFVNTTPDHLNDAVDLVTGWMFTAKIPESEYRREYEVVQRELEKDKGEADWVFYELAVANRYIKNPVRMPVVGYQEVIRGLSRDDVYNYYKMTYVPQNVIIAIAGNADPEQMVAAVRKYAGDVPPGRVPEKAISPEPGVSTPRTSVATFPKLGQAKLEIGFPSVRMYAPDMYALDVLATILGSGESSILVQEIRDQLHLVSSISAGDNTPAFVEGTFGVDMELAADKIKPATEAVLKVLDRIKIEGIDEDRLKRAKTQLRSQDAFQRQSSEAVTLTLLTSYLYTGYPEDIALRNYERVTAEQVKSVARRYFDHNRLLTTALLPEESLAAAGLPAAEQMLREAAPATTTARNSTGAENYAATRVELPDGTVILLKRVATAPVVSVQLYSLGGLTAEDDSNNGIGNLAMECVPRGTRSRSAEQIATFFDAIGGQLETTCGNNNWVWEVQCLRDDFDKAMEVFADLVHNPSFPEDEVKATRQRVQAAIESQDNNWRTGGMRYFRKVFFGPRRSPYQFTTLGTKQNVEKFSPDDLSKWYHDKVLAGRRVLAIYGDIDVEAARKVATRYFGEHRPRQSPAAAAAELRVPPPEQGTPGITIEDVKVQKWDNPETAVFIGFASDSVYADPQREPLIMADTLTSGYTYPTGYIFETLRGMGLVYDANAQNIWGVAAKLPGTFFAYAACDPTNADACIDQILLNIARLQGSEKDIDPDWFGRAQNLVTSVDAMENETAASQAATAALDEMYGVGYDYHASFPKRIHAVTPQQVRDVARARLRRCVIAVSTSKPELLKVKPGTRRYAEFPPVDLAPQGVQHDTGSAGK